MTVETLHSDLLTCTLRVQQEDKLSKVIADSGNSVEGYYPGLFAKALRGQDITKLLSNVGTAAPAAGGAAPAGGDAGAGAPAKEAESK